MKLQWILTLAQLEINNMGKLLVIMFVFSAIVVAMPMAGCTSTDQSPKAVEKWIRNLGSMKPKVTKLHFYLHDRVSGENPPSIPVAKASTTDNSPFLFGLVHVIDDPLTEGPDPTSPLIGRAQGLFATSSMQDEFSLLISMNLYFTTGDYTNSTLTIEGRNPILNQYRELSVVGGSGVFRLARGIATAQTFSLDLSTRDAIIEYNIVVLHY